MECSSDRKRRVGDEGEHPVMDVNGVAGESIRQHRGVFPVEGIDFIC